MDEYGTGRLHAPDDRDRAFPLSAAIPRAAIEPTPLFWRIGDRILDQGPTSQCVGYSARHWMEASPQRVRPDYPPQAPAIYAGAQLNDEWDGTNYEGSSVRGAMKFLQAQGEVTQYLWASTIEEVCSYIVHQGPIVFGTNWYPSMFSIDGDGYLNIDWNDRPDGHAYLLTGWSVIRQAFRGLTSWGDGWGQRGRFWLRLDDARRLLHDDGEAAGPTEKVYVRP